MFTREDRCRLLQAMRHSLWETTRMRDPAYAGAAYMQLFKRGRLGEMMMEKNGIGIENLN